MTEFLQLGFNLFGWWFWPLCLFIVVRFVIRCSRGDIRKEQVPYQQDVDETFRSPGIYHGGSSHSFWNDKVD